MLTEQMVNEATLELQEKSYQKIQYDTAMKWAARAVAAYRFSVSSTSADLALSSYEAGNEYAAEAIEHVAALEDGSLLENLSSVLAAEKELAFNDLVPDNSSLEEIIDEPLEEETKEAGELNSPEEVSNEAQS